MKLIFMNINVEHIHLKHAMFAWKFGARDGI
jgi:hypothetical protein